MRRLKIHWDLRRTQEIACLMPEMKHLYKNPSRCIGGASFLTRQRCRTVQLACTSFPLTSIKLNTLLHHVYSLLTDRSTSSFFLTLWMTPTTRPSQTIIIDITLHYSTHFSSPSASSSRRSKHLISPADESPVVTTVNHLCKTCLDCASTLLYAVPGSLWYIQ